MDIIKFAVIQSGYCVFGAGHTRSAAIEDAALWMDGPDNRQGSMSPDQVEESLVARPNDGDICLIEAGSEEFDSYLRNQGGYTLTADGWIAV